MTRRTIVVALTLALTSCSAFIRPGPQPPPRDRQVVVRVSDRGQLVAGAHVKVAGGVPAEQDTDAFGGVILKINTGINQVQVWVTKAGCSSIDAELPVQASGEIAALIDCTPPAPVVERATGESLLQVQANFCNLTDAQGRVIFTPFLATLWDQGDLASVADWLERMRAAGTTHVVLAPHYEYHSAMPYPIAGDDFRTRPAKFHELLEYLLAQPSADGRGFRPIVMLSDDFSEVGQYWPTLLPALRDLSPYVIFVPAWEPVGPGGAWSSAMLSQALARMHELLPAGHFFYHGTPDRGTFSSHPLEADDPWRGDEVGAWSSHGGELFEGFLFQTEHGDYVERPGCGRNVDDGSGRGLRYGQCWANRWDDVVARLGAGLCTDDYGHGSPCGWRKVRVVLFETVAFEYFRKQTDTDNANRIAREGLAICQHYGVTCGFGNGVVR